MDKVTWTEVVAATLPDARQAYTCSPCYFMGIMFSAHTLRFVACENIPLNDFAPTGGVALARYIRFNMKTYYGSSAGLKYFRTVSNGQEHCEFPLNSPGAKIKVSSNSIPVCPEVPVVDPESDPSLDDTHSHRYQCALTENHMHLFCNLFFPNSNLSGEQVLYDDCQDSDIANYWLTPDYSTGVRTTPMFKC